MTHVWPRAQHRARAQDRFPCLRVAPREPAGRTWNRCRSPRSLDHRGGRRSGHLQWRVQVSRWRGRIGVSSVARSLPLIAWRPLPERTCFRAAGLRNTGHRAAASTPAWPQCPRQTHRPSPAYTTFLPTSAGGCDEPLPLLPLTAQRAEHRTLGRLNRWGIISHLRTHARGTGLVKRRAS